MSAPLPPLAFGVQRLTGRFCRSGLWRTSFALVDDRAVRQRHHGLGRRIFEIAERTELRIDRMDIRPGHQFPSTSGRWRFRSGCRNPDVPAPVLFGTGDCGIVPIAEMSAGSLPETMLLVSVAVPYT